MICNQPVAGSSPIASSMNLKAFSETERPFLLALSKILSKIIFLQPIVIHQT
jgi:hypothetical protein